MGMHFLKVNGTKNEIILLLDQNDVHSPLTWLATLQPVPPLATQVQGLEVIIDTRLTLNQMNNNIVWVFPQPSFNKEDHV